MAKKGRLLGTVAKGALGALVLLFIVRNRKKLRPFLVTATQELYSFKEWLAVNVETLKEDVEDIAAEAKSGHEGKRSEERDLVEREKALRKKVSRVVREREAGGHA